MWVFLGLVACGALVGWFGRYPCHPDKLRYAFWFGAEERGARRTLDEGRAERKRIRDAADGKFGEATAAVDECLRPLNESLQILRGQQEALQVEAQDCGKALGDPLGPARDPEEWLQLYEHALVPQRIVQSEAGEPQSEWGEPLPLEGLVVETDIYLDLYVRLLVTLPGGQNRVRWWIYPKDADWAKRLSAFVRPLEEQIDTDSGFRAQLRAREAKNADAIRQADADLATAAETGKRQIGAAEQRRRKEHARADAIRDTAYGVWVRDAGGRRPWW